jgi:2,3-bisphosphoglycerate-independent phosphoglycerate mutase
MKSQKKPFVLCVLNGWGVSSPSSNNIISESHTPYIKYLLQEYPAFVIKNKQDDFFPLGMGKTEAAYVSMGTGIAYKSTKKLVDISIDSGKFFHKKKLQEIIHNLKGKQQKIHLFCLLSYSKKHSSVHHLLALLEYIKTYKKRNIFIHVILDGIDEVAGSGVHHVQLLEEKLKNIGIGKIASVVGRNWLMTLDNRWDRIECSYRAIVQGLCEHKEKDLKKYIEQFCTQEKNESELPPCVLIKSNEYSGKIENEDVVLFVNHSSYGMRHFVSSLALPSFSHFERKPLPDTVILTLTQYDRTLPVFSLCNNQKLQNNLTEILIKNELHQYYISETESQVYLEYYFQGNIMIFDKNIQSNVIDSPLVEQYNVIPEMSFQKMVKQTMNKIHEGETEFFVISATVPGIITLDGGKKDIMKSCKIVDKYIKKLSEYVLAKDGVLMITSANGLVEEYIHPQTEKKQVLCSENNVPCIIVSEKYRGQSGPAGDPPGGDLSLVPPMGNFVDIPSIILDHFNITIPKYMEGKSIDFYKSSFRV